MTTRQRRYRVSCFAPGVPIHDACARHYAPKTETRARLIYARERAKLIPGKYGRVVLHQGNLKRHSFAILAMQESWTELDEITVRHSAFDSFSSLLGAQGGYRPSINIAHPDLLKLADAYDAAQERRGDPRRAYRYGRQ